ncbi:MAG: hypothetical protein ACK46X_07345, partial [Candidatus Sericytochromatia bacterium]
VDRPRRYFALSLVLLGALAAPVLGMKLYEPVHGIAPRDAESREAYQALAPTLWDVDFRSAIAQAELEDRDQPAAYHRVGFAKTDGSGDVFIE